MADALHTHGAVVSAQEARIDDAGLIAPQSSTLDVRTGVLAAPGSTALVTGTSATGTMTYAIAAHHWVASRGVANGPYRGTLEAATTVPTAAAPGSNSRIDVIWSRQKDATAGVPTPDGSYGEEYGCTSGVAAVSPTKPTIPVGAVELATAVVTSSALSTNGAGVTITQTARQTVARGGIVPARTSDTDAPPYDGAYRDHPTNGLERGKAGAWGTPVPGLAGTVGEITAGPWETTTAAGTAAITAETVIMTVTATGLTVGREYRIEFSGNITGSVTDDRLYLAFRRTNLAGAQIDEFNSINAKAATAFGVLCATYDVATAATQTWVVTLQRFGTGNTNMAARGSGVNRLRVTPVA